MQAAIRRLQLDLSGLTVLTEAASGPYRPTPVLAALAGARKTYAVTRDSGFGKGTEIVESTLALARACSVAGAVEFLFGDLEAGLREADIVTNLGFVRPIDRAMVARMKPTGVVPYMAEAWEFRPGDVDLDACRERGIPVMGTNESHPGVNTLRACGPLCESMMTRAGVAAKDARVVVISNDPFGPVLVDHLTSAGSIVTLLPRPSPHAIQKADALVMACYRSDRFILGSRGDMTPEQLKSLAPAIRVIQFTGGADAEALNRMDIACFPPEQVPFRRMGRTLAELDPGLVIDLHAAGLKVGEAMAQARRLGLSGQDFVRYVTEHSPAQPMDGGTP